jgi:ribosome-associated protein
VTRARGQRQGLHFARARLSSDPVAFTVPDDELEFRASRASGPGGQHVNKTSTRVEVLWNVRTSAALTDVQRTRVLDKLSNRVDSTGVLRVAASERRSQLRNREAAAMRLNALVQEALRKPRPRKRTKPPRAAIEKRLEEKRRRSDTKQRRGRVKPED